MAEELELRGAYKRTKKGHVDYYYGGGEEAWASLALAKAGVPLSVREGKTVGVIESGEIVEYIWHPSDTSDTGLVKKQSDVEFNGTANKIPKFDSTGKNIENSGIEDEPLARNIKLDRASITFLPHAPHQLGGLVLENKVDDTVTTAVVYRSRNGVSSIEEVAYLSDISTPIDTSNLNEYEASTDYTKDENIFFTIDDEIFFYRVLQDFTSLDPVDIEAEITAGNLEKITEGKFIKVLDHDSTTKTIYTKNSVVKDPSSKVLYRAKQDADETIPLANTACWENITNSLEDIANTADPIITNDITTDVFTVSYLASHVDYVDFKPGKWVENINQLAQKTIQGWAIFNKKDIVEAEIDLDDTTIYDSGTGILDLSSVNTATDFILTTATATTAFTINKVTGLDTGRVYRIKTTTGITVTITNTALVSLGTGDVFTGTGADAVLVGNNIASDYFEFRATDYNIGLIVKNY